MNSLQKYKGYLIVVFILALLQFVWLPQWQAKQDNWFRLHNIERNLSRVNYLINQESEITELRDRMSAQLEAVEQRLQVAESVVRYRLREQERIEHLLRNHELDVAQISWRDGVRIDDMHTQVMDVRATGSFDNYLYFLAELQESDQQHLNMVQSDLNVRGQSATIPGTITARFSLQVQVQIRQDTTAMLPSSTRDDHGY